VEPKGATGLGATAGSDRILYPDEYEVEPSRRALILAANAPWTAQSPSRSRRQLPVGHSPHRILLTGSIVFIVETQTTRRYKCLLLLSKLQQVSVGMQRRD
jgi:hypothetical protein